MKEQPKHTPGPWKFDKGEIYGNDGRSFIAEVFDESESFKANGRLIVLAPELLKIVKMCLCHFRYNETISGSALIDSDTTLAMACEKAIAKAEGSK